ncbi:putative cyclase [Fonsecaea pedrosoi]|nr:putative cyclase [Fonsecaea pedrosoi]
MGASFPDFDNLPPVKDMPAGCAWGVFDKGGKKDVFGCLNKITPEAILTAASDIKEGVSISLNWPMGAVKKPVADRKTLEHRVISFLDSPMNFHDYDDEVEFNTQCSSQWDSLCHFYHQESAKGYNGCQPSVQDLTQGWGEADTEMAFPTLNHWHERGGLVGRGVLLDYKAYAEAKGIDYDPLDPHIITVADIEEVAKYQGLVFKQGDIFILRTGYTEAFETTADRQEELMARRTWAGVEQTKEAAKWLWNQGFAAVASDNIGFEAEDTRHIPAGETHSSPRIFRTFLSKPDCFSPPSIPPNPLRYAHRRTLGSESFIQAMCKEQTV